jgi:hypothetical protein
VKEQIPLVVLREKYFALVKQLRDGATVEITDADAEEGVRSAGPISSLPGWRNGWP